MKKLLTVLLLFVMCFPTLSACGPVSLSFAENSIEMQMYEEYDLNVTLNGADKSDIVWSSSDTSILIVRDGRITAVGMGSAVITAKCGNVEESCEVYVSGKTSRALIVNKSSVTMPVGDETQLTATLKERGKPLENVNIVWESALPDVVSVDQSGNIKALKKGKAVVSAYTYYKGQHFTKDVVVTSTHIEGRPATLSVQDTGAAGTSLTELGLEKTAYGFAETERAYRYVSGGGFESRIFADGAYTADNQPNYDKFLFKIRFTEEPTSGTTVYLANHKGIKGMNNLMTANGAFVFYDGEGKVATAFDVNTTYTVLINLNKVGGGRIADGAMIYEYGFCFEEATEAYVGGAVLCTEDYFLQEYGDYETVEELPDLTCVYIEAGASLETGEETISGFDKYWITSSTSDTWSNRVAIGGVSVSKYLKYTYMRLDVVLTSVAIKNIYIWNGGKPFKYSAQGAIVPNKEEYTISGDDFTVFLGDADVTGQPLVAGKRYTFRIRIQNINEAFGIAVSSSTVDTVYVGNPLLVNY